MAKVPTYLPCTVSLARFVAELTLDGESGAVGSGAGDVGRRALVPGSVPSVGSLTAQRRTVTFVANAEAWIPENTSVRKSVLAI